jgi:pyruvate dehydrogenase E1 component
VQLWASGPMVQTAIAAQKILADDYDVSADIWSVTSYQQLYRDGRAAQRHNRLHPVSKPKVPYVAQAMQHALGPIVAVSDWVSELPAMVAPMIDRTMVRLGTNGFGRSDTREALRAHFEIDAPQVVTSALYGLMQDGAIDGKVVAQAMKTLGVQADRPDPMTA